MTSMLLGDITDDATNLVRCTGSLQAPILLGTVINFSHSEMTPRNLSEVPPSPRPRKGLNNLFGKLLLAPQFHNARRLFTVSRVAPLNYNPTASLPPVAFRAISPASTAKFMWGVWYDLLILYSLCTTAYYLAFEKPGLGMTVLDVCVWVMFLIDIPLSFITQYEDDSGVMVADIRLTARRYMRTWLFPDVISLIPYSFFGLPEVEYYHRMVRLVRVPDSIDFIDGTGLGAIFVMLVPKLGDIRVAGIKLTYLHVSKVMQRVSKLLLVSYFLACFFYWFAKETKPIETNSTEWFGVDADMESLPGGKKLLYSWYFMLTTLFTIGYGDFRPRSVYEELLMVFILLVGIANYSIVMGNFIALVYDIIDMNSKTDAIGEVSVWMDALEGSGHFIPPGVKMRIIRHFNSYRANDRLGSLAPNWWTAESTKSLLQSPDPLFHLLPMSRQREILDTIFSDVFYKYDKFLGGKSSDLRYSLCLHFQPRTFEAGEVILEPNDDPAEIYLLLSGSVGVSTKVYETSHTFLTCNDRMVFGDYEVLGHTGNRFTYRALGRRSCEVLCLPAKPFLDILNAKYLKVKQELFVRASMSMHMQRKLLYAYLEENRIALRCPTEPSSVKLMLLHVVKLPNEGPAATYKRLKSANNECIENIRIEFQHSVKVLSDMRRPISIIKSKLDKR